jgi:hypothetical protein
MALATRLVKARSIADNTMLPRAERGTKRSRELNYLTVKWWLELLRYYTET